LSTDVQLWYFYIKSFCRKNGAEVPDVVGFGSTDTEHAIEVENGTTLDFDFRVQTTLHNPSPGTPALQFEQNGQTAVSWTAAISPLGPTRADVRAAKLTCSATTSCTVVADSAKIEFREDANYPWQEDPNPPKKLHLPISIK
jgi:hypothetical protein